MESEAKRFVRILATFAAIEQVLLEVFTDSEQLAAGGVSCSVDTIGTSNTTSQCPFENMSVVRYVILLITTSRTMGDLKGRYY